MKNKFPKLLSVFLSLVLLISQVSGTLAFADTTYEITDYALQSEYETASSYLDMMGLSSKYPESLPVTRGYAVNAIVTALGLENVAKNGNAAYSDYEKMAEVAHNLGILSGSTPVEWALGSDVTPSQLCKMFVVALGYGNIIAGENAFPMQYVNQATKLGITQHLSNTNASTVSYEEFVVMMYYAMNAVVLKTVGITGNDTIYSQNENYTLEDVYLDALKLNKETGIVEADYYTSATPSDNKCQPSQIVIGGVDYNCDSAKCKGFVGMNVEFVYGQVSGFKGKTVVGIRPLETNKFYSFNRNPEIEYDNGKILYYEANDKQKSITLSDGVIVVYNNQICTSYSFDDFDLAESYLKIIDNNDDNKYDMLFISQSESAIVNKVIDNKIYLKTGTINSKKMINLSDEDEVSFIIHDISGNIIPITDIKEGSAISVVASKDFSYIEVILLEEKKEGLFESFNESLGIVTVGGKDYGLKISASDFSLGKTYRFFSNEHDEIFYIETISDQCVYVVDRTYVSQGLSSYAKLKVYSPDTGLVTYDIAPKFTVDGVSYDNISSAPSAIRTQTLAYVRINNDDKVREIEYLETYSDRGMRAYCEYANGFNDMSSSYNPATPFRYDESTIFFYVPTSNADEDFGFIVPLVNGDEYQTEAFNINQSTGCAGAVVVELDTDVRNSTQLTYRSDIAIIKSISQIIDVDEQPVYKITAYHEGKEDTFYSGHYPDVFSVCSGLEKGDVIGYVENYNDEIVHIKKYRSMSELSEYFVDGYGTTNEQIFGQAVVLNKDVLTNESEFLVHQMGVSTTSDYNNLTNLQIWASVDNPHDSSAEFSEWYVYNRATEEVKPASVDDIMTYDNVGTDATKLFVLRTRSDVRFVVVIEDK